MFYNAVSMSMLSEIISGSRAVPTASYALNGSFGTSGISGESGVWTSSSLAVRNIDITKPINITGSLNVSGSIDFKTAGNIMTLGDYDSLYSGSYIFMDDTYGYMDLYSAQLNVNGKYLSFYGIDYVLINGGATIDFGFKLDPTHMITLGTTSVFASQPVKIELSTQYNSISHTSKNHYFYTQYVDSFATLSIITGSLVKISGSLDVTGSLNVSGSIKGIHKTMDGTSSVADGNYTVGLGIIQDGILTMQDGIITNIQGASYNLQLKTDPNGNQVFLLFVDSGSGNDANDGLKWSTAKKTFSGSLSLVPNDLSGYECIIYAHSGYYNEQIDLTRFQNGLFSFVKTSLLLNTATGSMAEFIRQGDTNPIRDDNQVIIEFSGSEVIGSNSNTLSMFYGGKNAWVYWDENDAFIPFGWKFIGDNIPTTNLPMIYVKNTNLFLDASSIELEMNSSSVGIDIGNANVTINGLKVIGGNGPASTTLLRHKGVILLNNTNISLNIEPRAAVGNGILHNNYGLSVSESFDWDITGIRNLVSSWNNTNWAVESALSGSGYAKYSSGSLPDGVLPNLWLSPNDDGYINYRSDFVKIVDESVLPHIIKDNVTNVSKYFITSQSYDDGTNLYYKNNIIPTKPVTIAFACSDENTQLSASTDIATFYMPHSLNVTNIKASLNISGSTSSSLDIRKNGTTVFDAPMIISASAYTASRVPITSSFASDDRIAVDLNTAGTSAAGLKIYILGN